MQDEQLAAVQPAHLSNPPMGMETPLESLEVEVKVDKILCPWVLHRGQKASSLAQFIERSSSNLLLQFGQKYS